ncbi:MAG: glutamate 5-kinase [Deltaproteobacteria bacterium]
MSDVGKQQTAHKGRILAGAKRLVVKLGSSVVTTADALERERIGRLAAELARLHEDGYQIIVVSSGARAAGLARLGLERIPSTIAEQQAAAAIGQISLMALYEEFFADHGKHVGQVLLTAGDIADRTRYLNARHTLAHLLDHGIIPVVNENDSVAIEELKFGDNDRLSALVAGLAEADLLVLLTDVDGVYEGEPGKSELVAVIDDTDTVTPSGPANPATLGTGGMASKLEAARAAAKRGIPSVIASGLEAGVLAAIVDPTASAGTLVLGSDEPMSNRKHWIAYGIQTRGRIIIDDGARRALAGGASLLPIGMVKVEGDFTAGDAVSICDQHGTEFARGLVAYEAADCGKLVGTASGSIESRLGYHVSDEVIHRDDLVVLDDASGA